MRTAPVSQGTLLEAGVVRFMTNLSPVAITGGFQMRRMRLAGAALAVTIPVAASLAPAVADVRPADRTEAKGSFKLIGHSPLDNRGMNAALAVHGDYAYVGSRTDGKPLEENLTNAGVLVVDVSDPKSPEVVHRIGPPHEGHEGETSREMRVWRNQDLLIVMNLGSNCSYLIHACSPRAAEDNFRFYDISGKNGAEPKFVAEYKPSRNPHEFYIWQDPKRRNHALMFMSTPNAAGSEMLVTDISKARKKKFKEIGMMPAIVNDGYLHSMGLSNDGRRAYLAYNSGGFLVVDTSEFVTGKKKPEVRVITSPDNRADWDGPSHSAVKLFGKPYVLNTDELYGDLLRALGSGGCPWGWARMIDIKKPEKPKVVAEYRLEYNHADFCTTDAPRPSSSFSSHNPTLTKSLAFISWHAGGLQAVDITNPRKPRQAAEFVPEPLPYVVTEDPALTAGQDKVAMWSFPVIQDGLVYVVDVRNGLYILKYGGTYAQEVNKIDFIEGNSNQGTALKFEKP